MNEVNKLPEEQNLPDKIIKRVEELKEFMERFIAADAVKVKAYVDKLREQNPDISNDDLARKIISRKSLKCGIWGAVTGVGGFTTAFFTIPANIVATWKIQVTMIIAIAHVYGHTEYTMDLKTDILLIMAGSQATEALKRAGIEIGKAVTKKLVQKYITREVMVKIWSVVGRSIITKAGTRSLLSFTKLVPLVSAPIGFVIDWVIAKAIGKLAIKYYSGCE